MKRTALALVLFGTAFLQTCPSIADGAIAVGVPARGPYYGFSWGASADQGGDESQTHAVQICRGQDPVYRAPKGQINEAQSRCGIVGTFRDQCAGMAFNGDQNTPATAYGWAIAPDSDAVTKQAIVRCEAMRGGRGRECHLDAFICDGSAK